MEKRKRRIFLLVAICFCLCCLSLAVFFGGTQAFGEKEISLGYDAVPEQVLLSTVVELPQSISVSYEGGVATAENGVVVWPDGRVSGADGEFTFSQTGVYSLQYFFYADDVRFTASQTVSVCSEYFSFSSDNGSEAVLTDETNKLTCGKDGVFVNLKSGAQFVYSKPIDLSDCGEDGLSPIIEMDARLGHFDENGYVSDVSDCWIRLTDCYNPNIYVEILMKRSENYNGALFSGIRTCYQPCTGLDISSSYPGISQAIVLDGKTYRLWPEYGGFMNAGLPNMQQTMTTGITWKYEPETMRFYVSFNGGSENLAVDLDEPLIYGDNLFPGFTTGEVYLSIYAEGYTSSIADIEIVSVGYDNIYDVATEKYVDTKAPVITVNAEKSTATGIYGAVGDTVVIPEANATDVNLSGEAEVRVYRSYGTAYQCDVSIENNSFVLAEHETYTIVYTAKDTAGNVARELFTVETKNTSENKSVILQPQLPERFTCGESTVLGYEIGQSLNVSADAVSVNISVTSANQTESLKSDETFVPQYAGDYTVTYVYGDGFFTYEKTVSVACVASGNVCFLEAVEAPRAFVKNGLYDIENIVAYTFTNGVPEEYPTKAYLAYENGSETEITDFDGVKIDGDGSVRIVYRAGDAELASEYVPIVDVSFESGIDMAKYFTGNFTAVAADAETGRRTSNITFNSDKTEGDNVLSFINKISARSFALTYRVRDDEGNFSSLCITLTDSVNDSYVQTITIFNEEDGAYIAIGSGSRQKLDFYSFTGNSQNTVSYSYADQKLSVGKNTFSLTIDFPSGECYLDIGVYGIYGNAAITVSAVNNQRIRGTAYKDDVAPEIYYRDSQGDYAVGESVTVYAPEFSDVLSGVDLSTASFTIYCSDGKAAKDIYGNEITSLSLYENRTVLLDRITGYYVTYSVADRSGNVSTVNYLINCIDTTAPTLTLDGISEKETLHISAGGKVHIGFTVSDDYSEAQNLTAYIHLYCDDMFSFVPNVAEINDKNRPTDGKYSCEFAITIKGNYTAQIHVYDEAGNHTVKYVKIIVE